MNDPAVHWLRAVDVAAFDFVNRTLSNPVFDRVMPWLSWNRLFVPLLIVAVLGLLWKGGTRGRLCVAMLIVILPLGDSWIVNTIKQTVHRPRPCYALPEARVLGGRTHSGSMPSAHAANWFAATAVLAAFYRRSWRFMAPVAAAVAFSRVYNGMHYPSDVLAGALLGLAYGTGALWLLDGLWQWTGKRWFPLWWARLPSLRNATQPGTGPASEAQGSEAKAQEPEVDNQRPKAEAHPSESALPPPHSESGRHWFRLGYGVIGLVLVAQLVYLASGKIQLSEDEAYQWLWSKHLALSYYSKPPLIAYTQWLATRLWGDTEFGVRFFSPVIGAVLGCLVLGFVGREVGARAGFWAVVIAMATPLLAVGETLMTIDSLSALFWMAAVVSGWRAVQSEAVGPWLWTGAWLALGFLSKYTELFQLLGWALFFALCGPARRHLRRPGPWLALLVNLLGTVPVLLWNGQHGWITLTQLESRASLNQPWTFTLRHLGNFLLAETALLNPVFFGACLWAAVMVTATQRRRSRPFWLYLWCMGVPLFLVYLLYTVRALVQPNWIAPSVLPLFCLMIAYWDSRWRSGCRTVKGWLAVGLTLGLALAVLLHDTDLVGRITGRQLPPKHDPLARVRAWRGTTQVVEAARRRLLAEGEPVFIIGDHYGISSLLTFYLPAARAGVPGHPLVFCLSSARPENQFFFWPSYRGRQGQNAIYVQQVHHPAPPPERLRQQFNSVTDLGMRNIPYRGRVYRTLQLFACRGLR